MKFQHVWRFDRISLERLPKFREKWKRKESLRDVKMTWLREQVWCLLKVKCFTWKEIFGSSWYYFQFVFIYLLILEMIITWIVDVAKPHGWFWIFSFHLWVLCYFVSFLLFWVFVRYLFVCVNHFSSFIWLGFAHFLVFFFFFFWKLIELKYDIKVYHLWFSLFWLSFGL